MQERLASLVFAMAEGGVRMQIHQLILDAYTKVVEEMTPDGCAVEKEMGEEAAEDAAEDGGCWGAAMPEPST